MVNGRKNVKGIEFKNTIESAKEQVKEFEKLGKVIISFDKNSKEITNKGASIINSS